MSNEGKTRQRYKVMASNLKFDVRWEWLSQFDDIDKLRALNQAIRYKGDNRFGVLTTEWYKAYIHKFYHCRQFNTVYQRWVASGKNPLHKPSLDHIHPISKGGDSSLSNLQFISWLENKFKHTLSLCEWNDIKADIHSYLI